MKTGFIFAAIAALLVAVALMCNGCSATTGLGLTPAKVNSGATQLNNALQANPSAVQNALLNGLNKLAAAHPGDAKDLAVAVGTTAQLGAASFSGQVLPTGPAAQLVLNNLFTGAPASAAGIVTTISGMIQLAVTIPSGSDNVSPQVAALIVTVCNDLNVACQMFLSQTPPVVIPPPAITQPPVVQPSPAVGGASDAEKKTLRDYGITLQ